MGYISGMIFECEFHGSSTHSSRRQNQTDGRRMEGGIREWRRRRGQGEGGGGKKKKKKKKEEEEEEEEA